MAMVAPKKENVQKSLVIKFTQFTGLERDSLRNDFRSPPANSSRIINLLKEEYFNANNLIRGIIGLK